MIVGYIRGSTSEQKITIEAQRSKIQSFGKLQDFPEIAIYTDEATTSHIKFCERDAGRLISEGIEEGTITGIIICKLDRAFRDTREMLETIDIWSKNDVAVYVLDFGGSILDTTSATGRFFLTIRAAIDELERTQISERTKIALAHLRSENKLICRPDRIPFGYGIASGKPGKGNCILKEIPEEQAIIKRILAMKDNGMTPKEIGKLLRKEGIMKRSMKWYTLGVERVIKASA